MLLIFIEIFQVLKCRCSK